MYCLNMLEIALLPRQPRPRLRGPRDEVLRALRRHRRRADEQGCGTRRTASSTTGCACRTAGRCRCRCARWSACCRFAAYDARPGDAGSGLPDFARAARWFLDTSRTSRRAVVQRCVTTASSRRLLALVDDGAAAPHPRADARPGGVPVAVRPAHALALPPRAPVHVALDGGERRSTTSRPSRPPGCSAATPTGAGRSGSRSTTSSSRRCGICHAYPRRRLHGRVPDRLGRAGDARRRSPTTSRAGWLRLFLLDDDGRRPVLRRRRRCSRRDPAWRDQHPVPRVLPRRHRRRASARRTRPAGRRSSGH